MHCPIDQLVDHLTLNQAVVGSSPTRASIYMTQKKKNIDWMEIQKYYNLGNSIRECAQYFSLNPNTIMLASKRGEFTTRSSGKGTAIRHSKSPFKHSQETKDILRDHMVKRRANGYNWSLAHSKNNGISWPEQYWMNVIQNEFRDKEYVFQYQFGRFAIDFAWPHKKIALEIDGDQHYTQPEQRQRDANKEMLLETMGWTLIRVRWKAMFKNPKKFINDVKNVIDNT